MLRSAFFTTLALTVTTLAQAQFQGKVFVEDSTIKAFVDNQQRSIAWCGGFSNPQFAMGDLNGDGKPDLAIYEPWGIDRTRVFINVGAANKPNYQYAPYYAEPFNITGTVLDYLKLVDYNLDNVPDLITKGMGGFTVYKGRRVNGRVEFTLYKELRYKSNPGQTINCYSQASDIPAVDDVDGDGDLDFFGYNEDGAIIYFFKNCRAEHGLPPDSIDICKPSNCWGAMNQGVVRKFTLGVTNGSLYCPTTFTYNCNKGTLHSGNTLCLVDMDGDGDMDLLDGNISFKDIQYLKNGRIEAGNTGRDSMVAQDTLWQTGGVQVDMPYWPAAFHVDIDGDGKKDILVSPHAYNISENYKTIAFYKNTGTITSPNFVYQNDTFLVDKALDFGSMTYPVLYDYDKDGRLDLFVGSDGFYQKSDGSYRSKIAYYKNNLVGGVTRFDLQTSDFMGIYGDNIRGAYPAFGDLDNDGKDDMVVGHADGTISFYKNNATAANMQPLFAAGIALKDDALAAITPTGHISPVIYDIDKDGKPDLLLTGEVGTVFYYKNVSAGTGNLKLHYITDTLGGMMAADNSYSFATMFIGKMDNTGKEYILLGNSSGTLRRYTGFESGNTTVPYQKIDDQYSELSVRERSAVTIGDVNGDGKYEMFIGSSLGGLQQFRQDLIVNPNPTQAVGTIHNSGVCSIYPNPATDVFYMNWDNAFAGRNEVNVRLINMTGQIAVKTSFAASKGAGQINVGSLPAGIYTFTAQAGDNIYSAPVLIKK